jgi:hypothetical protein
MAVEILQFPFTLRYSPANVPQLSVLLPLSCFSCSPYNISVRNAYKTLLIVRLQSFLWEHVCLRSRYSVTAACTCLLRMCYLAAEVVWLFVSRSLHSNGSTRYNINNTTSIGLNLLIYFTIEHTNKI